MKIEVRFPRLREIRVPTTQLVGMIGGRADPSADAQSSGITSPLPYLPLVKLNTEKRTRYPYRSPSPPHLRNTSPLTAQLASRVGRRVRKDRTGIEPSSQYDSIADEDADLSDSYHSETGNHRDRSNVSGSGGRRKKYMKKYMTIEEGETAYNAARNRVFKDFEDWGISEEMSAREASPSSQVSSSDTVRTVKGDRRAQPFTTGRSSSDPVTRGTKQSGDTVIPLKPLGHEGSSTPPLPSFFPYQSVYGRPPPLSGRSRRLYYPSMGYTGDHRDAHYPPPPGKAAGKGLVPQYPLNQSHSHQQQRVLVDAPVPSVGRPTFYQPLHSQSQQRPYLSPSSLPRLSNAPSQPPRTQNNIPTLSNSGDDYPGWPNPSSRLPPPDSDLINPRELFVEVWCPLPTYDDTADIFTLEPRRLDHLNQALYPLLYSECSANVWLGQYSFFPDSTDTLSGKLLCLAQ